MLTVSDRLLTTQTSVPVRGTTVTGSSPTGIAARCASRPSPPTSNTSSSASAVLTASSVSPDGVSAIGWTWDVS